MKCSSSDELGAVQQNVVPQIEHVDSHIHIPAADLMFPATDSETYYSFMVAEPMVNDDPLAKQEPTGAGNDEETNDEEFVFHGSVEKKFDRTERMLMILCRVPQLRTEQQLKPDRTTEELQLEPTYDTGVLSKWFQEKGYGLATVGDKEVGYKEVFVHCSALRGGAEGACG